MSPTFSAMSYNILARSLGSNCIPWVMTLGPEFKKMAEETAGMSWDAWKKEAVAPMYLQHFHKNFQSGDYTGMRAFWSAKQCSSQADIPSTLSGITFHSEDRVKYLDKAGNEQVATIMKGVLREGLPAVGQDIFTHLLQTEDEVFAWPSRGPRLFQTMMAPLELKAADTVQTSGADIISIMEFDAFQAAAPYRGVEETFPAALDAVGFDTILFKDPLKGKTPWSGVGVAWRREAFTLDTEAAEMQMAFECGEGIPGAVLNVDMEEHWHRIKKDDPKPPEKELMPEADRRNVGFCRLKHKATGKRLVIIASHLMTTSRDSHKTNLYPGEVRAGEIVAIREAAQSFLRPGDAVLFSGDFNVNASDYPILAGQVEGGSSAPSFATGLELRDGHRVFNWTSQGESFLLREAFEDVHRWGEAVDPQGVCTSINAERTEWIDYMWTAGLARTAHSSNESPGEGIPTRKHASDHLPIAAAFTFADSQG